MLEEPLCFLASPEQDQVVGQPEAAGEESAFRCFQTVLCASRIVAHHQTVKHEVPLDCLHRGAHAGVGGWKKSHQRNEKGARIELGHPVALHEASELGVVPFVANILVDLCAYFAPSPGGTLEAKV